MAAPRPGSLRGSAARILFLPLFLASSSLVAQGAPSAPPAAADVDGAVTIAEAGRPLLTYQARRVALPAGYLDAVAAGNRIYAEPRSGYLHPLYGLDGEELTLDWSLDHPHHRGIYWAWPEVRWGERLGDLHALQQVFSRPVGEPALAASAGSAQVQAQNLWLWEDQTPVAFERVSIQAAPIGADGARTVDLELRFEALVDGLSLARRGTDLYGGLNVRLAPVEDLEFARGTKEATLASPGGAWSSATGTWRGGGRRTTLAILEHPANPGFPGDFITYEDLPWFQPAFPPAGTRHQLERGRPLTLRYRFLILPGDADPAALVAACDRYAATALSPILSLPGPTER